MSTQATHLDYPSECDEIALSIYNGMVALYGDTVTMPSETTLRRKVREVMGAGASEQVIDNVIDGIVNLIISDVMDDAT